MKEKKWKPGRIAAITLIAVITLGAWIASGNVMMISSIGVEGSDIVPADEVIRLSGLQYGQAILSVNSFDIKQRVESNRFLRFVALDKQYPSRVVIMVETRKPVAILQYMGNYLLADAEGVVIARYSQLEFSEDLPFITGLEITEAMARLDASIIASGAPNALAAFNIINELNAQEMSDGISELNVADLDNIYLVTLDGIQVMLGDNYEIPAKIALAKAVLPQLPSDTKPGGLLDVTAVNKADYLQTRISKTSSLDEVDSQSVFGQQ
ncbi:MAG: cell division protein FtsQ/DivIB [Oscillospiraceae bacterium]|jgi:cell division protein FtsQ|nr:cell division protein FtsQ/DivIB [Oscillospiraceae bacterium]